MSYYWVRIEDEGKETFRFGNSPSLAVAMTYAEQALAAEYGENIVVRDADNWRGEHLGEIVYRPKGTTQAYELAEAEIMVENAISAMKAHLSHLDSVAHILRGVKR